MRRLAFSLAFAAMVAVSSNALATNTPDTPADPPPKELRRYYGWQNIVVGYTGLGLAVHGFLSESNLLMLAGATTFTFGGSFVHGAHNNPGAAVATPFLTAAPVVLIGLAAASSDHDAAETLGGLAVLYALAAPIIDNALGHDDDPTRDVPIFTRVGLGIARFRARQPAAGNSVTGATTQFGTGIELSVGTHVRNFVIAATLLEHIVTFDSMNRYSATSPLGGTTSFTHVTIGPTVEWHARRRGGAFVGGTLGIAHYARHTSETPSGYAISAHGGYDVVVGDRSSIGVSLRILYSSMRTTEYGGSTVQVFTPSLMVSYAYR